MKITTKQMTLAALFVLTAAPAFAAGVDWNSDPLAGAREALAQAQKEHPVAVPAARPVSEPKSAPAIELYEGEMTLGGRRVALRLRLSTEDYDRYRGDPDMSQGVYVSRQGRLSEDGQPECSTAWERDDDWLHECSGLFMIGIKDAVEKGWASGDVFDRLDRFDTETGGLRVQPVGRFTLHKVVAVPAGAIAATPVGSNVHPYADELGGKATITDGVDAYLSQGHDRILADFSSCNERFDDCNGLRFVFSQLTVDFASKTVKLGADTVATLSYDAQTAENIAKGFFDFGNDGIDHAYEIKWAAGWKLGYRIDGSARVSVALSK